MKGETGGRRTVGLFLDLQGDGLPGHLQEMDGLAQRLPFQTDPIDGQDAVPDMNSSGPVGLAEETDRRQHRLPPWRENCQPASAPTGPNKEACCSRRRKTRLWNSAVAADPVAAVTVFSTKDLDPRLTLLTSLPDLSW